MSARHFPAPTEVTYSKMRFLITHNPSSTTISNYIQVLKKYRVHTVVRLCEASYDSALLQKEGIEFFHWPLEDGSIPSEQIVSNWLSLLKRKFSEEPGCCVAVHCAAGLGRAPVLVALALIEEGMNYELAVRVIRHKRRGAFNNKQLEYLEKYQPRRKLRFQAPSAHRDRCCFQ